MDPTTPLQQLLSQYGLVALVLVATVEGDLSLLVAGVLVHVGIFPLLGAILAGAIGNLAGDSVWFWVGRRLGPVIRRSRFYRAVGPRVERLAGRIGAWEILAARVVWGTRNASMFFWGQRGLGFGRFLWLDTLGCLVASTGFVLIGYGVGQGTTALVGQFRRLEHWLALAVVVGIVIVWGLGRLVRHELED
ncbi:MAG TPA: VTT domain-containing protein [Gemmatimonadales bacterium]|nr:VTT domain-containing protein [Gemmatimonadales bacterium]